MFIGKKKTDFKFCYTPWLISTSSWVCVCVLNPEKKTFLFVFPLLLRKQEKYPFSNPFTFSTYNKYFPSQLSTNISHKTSYQVLKVLTDFFPLNYLKKQECYKTIRKSFLIKYLPQRKEGWKNTAIKWLHINAIEYFVL